MTEQLQLPFGPPPYRGGYPYPDPYEFATLPLECSRCGWSGPGRDATVSEVYDEIVEYACPRCGHDPWRTGPATLESALKHWDQLPASEREYAVLIARAQRGESLSRDDYRKVVALWEGGN